MNRLTVLVALGLFASAATAAPGAMRSAPAARPAAPTTQTTARTAASPTTARSTTTTHATGQPNASCEVSGNQPGNSITAPGSAFNPDGVAGNMYAGSQPQNSKNPVSVSQYDVACASNHSH